MQYNNYQLCLRNNFFTVILFIIGGFGNLLVINIKNCRHSIPSYK